MTTAEPPPSPRGSVSPFLAIPAAVTAHSPAPSIIHLKRDQHSAVSIDPASTLQTRFGEFPHSSFVGIPPGSQVRASAPRTSHDRKRKRTASSSSSATTPAPETTENDDSAPPTASGFLHILAPTSELWTASLPHRTQVVYTPDSSYILHRLGVKPGSQIIEAGAGSGSFTHAAVRAVYSGYPDGRDVELEQLNRENSVEGRVWSFEFHAERAEKLMEEIRNHGLDTLVEVTHKDVCAEGFMVPVRKEQLEGAKQGSINKGGGQQKNEGEDIMIEEDEGHGAFQSPGATAIFLDLPAPWLALPHLTRAEPSPLAPDDEVTICTFSPCIEQVTRTCSTLRSLGWVDLSTVEISHQRLEVRRQLARGYDEGAGPRSILEALHRLKGVNEFRDQRKDIQTSLAAGGTASFVGLGFKKASSAGRVVASPDEGSILSRNEPDIKSHTSFLTFAKLPRVWTPGQEMDTDHWVRENESKGVVVAVVGEKERKWKGEQVESKRSKKKRERATKEEGEGREMDIDEYI